MDNPTFNLTLLYTDEEGVGWFETEDKKLSFDLPLMFQRDDRSYTICDTDTVKVEVTGEGCNFYAINAEKTKVLFISTIKTDDGYEIFECRIYKVNKISS